MMNICLPTILTGWNTGKDKREPNVNQKRNRWRFQAVIIFRIMCCMGVLGYHIMDDIVLSTPGGGYFSSPYIF